MAPGESYTLDDLAVLTGQAAPALLAELAALELAGRVVRVGGGNFAKT
jgi:predicted Rossmann fold nucleotide-binding protein DprA/Smf involved in DNA uptake